MNKRAHTEEGNLCLSLSLYKLALKRTLHMLLLPLPGHYCISSGIGIRGLLAIEQVATSIAEAGYSMKALNDVRELSERDRGIT